MSAAYRTVIDQIEKDGEDVFMAATLVEQLRAHPGWQLVADSIAAHEQRCVDRLINPTTKPEQIPYLRGEITGLRSMREAAETIVSRAEEVAETNRRKEIEHV